MSSGLDDPVGEVRRRADIVEVISEQVVLKRSGRNYLGLCPFHGERTPSFNVNPERQIFRCFGCGEGGDVFSFVMKASHQTFPEALKTLADRYGVELPDRRPEDDDRKLIREVNEKAAGFFRWMLDHAEWGAAARDYLVRRGVSAAWQAKFQLGYAPAHWDGLHRFLLQEQVPVGLQEKSALVRARTSGSGHYDYFRNRIMFPIHNEAGHVVGFGARAIDAADEPKYLNSPETLLYHKGQLLYGLNVARDAIKARDEAVLMEGYMDVISAHSHGFGHAVGVLGTALTPAQARILLRYTPSKRVILAFDADKAGQNAAERGLQTLGDVARGVELQLRVLSVPAGKDPDAFLRQEGAEAFERLLEQAPDFTRFLLERAIAPFDTQAAEGRSRAVSACVPLLRQIENLITRDYYVTWLSQFLGVREEAIRLEIKRGMGHNGSPARGALLTVKKLSAREAEQILLYLMVERDDLRQAVREQLADIGFEPLHQTIRERIDAVALAGGGGWPALLDHFAGQAAQKTVSAIMFAEYDRGASDLQRLGEDCINTLLLAHGERHVAELAARLKQVGSLEEETLVLANWKAWNEYCLQMKQKRNPLAGSSGHHNKVNPEDN